MRHTLQTYMLACLTNLQNCDNRQQLMPWRPMPVACRCEDALAHLLNYVFPNIFETSPHIVAAVSGAIDGMRLALGPGVVLNYVLQVCLVKVKSVATWP